MALNTLNFCFSALAGGSASTRSTVLRIMNWKAAKPITPMISATKNTRVPMMFWFASKISSGMSTIVAMLPSSEPMLRHVDSAARSPGSDEISDSSEP